MRRMFSMLGCLVALFFITPMFAGVDFSGTDGCEDPSMVVHFDLNACDAVIGLTNEDYSEMQAAYPETTKCGYFQAEGGHLYRENPTINTHSCTPGLNGTEAMCVSSLDDCDFVPYHEKAVRFDITLTPKDGEIVNLSGLEFYEKAPEMFEWVDGASGPNNYPQRYGVRITIDSVQIYRREDIKTGRDWNLESFDFSTNPNFSVTSKTTFHFELLPYCTFDNDSPVNAWDVEDIKITSCCNSCHAESSTISTEDDTNICINNQNPAGLSINVLGGFGEDSDFLLVDDLGNIIDIENASPISFNAGQSSVTSVYFVQYDDDFEPLQVGDNIFEEYGCFRLSNPIDVNIFWLNTPQIYTNSNTTFCTSQVGDYVVEIENNAQTDFNEAYVITDDNGLILSIDTNPSQDLTGYGLGSYHIYYVLFDDLTGLSIGNNIFNLLGCFDISNSVEITVKELLPSTINIDAFAFCQGQNNALNVFSNGGSNAENVFIILNDSGTIVHISNVSSIDISHLMAGNYQVFEVLFEDLQGLSVGSQLNELDGCYVISNSQTFEITAPNAGVITTEDPTEYCSTEEEATIQVNLDGSTANNNVFVLTNIQGEILFLSVDGSIPLDLLAGVANYQIWNIAYDGAITGLDIGQNLNDIIACFDLSVPINIFIDCVDGGVISTDDETNICLSDDTVSFTIDTQNSKGSTQNFVITDIMGNVVFTSNDQAFDYVLTGSGTQYEIWNVSYGDNEEVLAIGDHIDDLSGCFDTSNALPFTVKCVNGGLISTESSTELCSTDGDAIIDINVTETKGENGEILLVDSSGEIVTVTDDYSLLIPTTGSGTAYTIYHVSYTEETSGINEGNNLEELDGCFDLSNGIDINIHCVEGGMISTESPTEWCSADLNANFTIDLNDQKGDNQQFVIADADGNIISIHDQSTFDLALTGSGTYDIISVSYADGVNGLIEGGNVQDVEGCFDWSNVIPVTVDCVEGGHISTDQNTVICSTEEYIDLDIALTGSKGDEQLFIVTDETGEIVYQSNTENIAFALTGSGTYYDVWSVSYTEETTGLSNGNNIVDANGCFDLSNPISIEVLQVNGGTISTDSPTVICSASATAQFDIMLDGSIGEEAVFVVNDASGNIIHLDNDNSLDVSTDGTHATYSIWSVAYVGNVEGLSVGQPVDELAGCFDVSNAITFEVISAEGGQISTASSTSICSNDDAANIELSLINDIGAEQTFILTNEAGEIVSVHTDEIIDVSNLGAGNYQIWNISYYGDTTGIMPGAYVSSLTGCYDLSNPISISVFEVDGGSISTLDPTSICSTEDYISLDVNLVGALGLHQHLVVIDENGTIVHVDNDNALGFNLIEGITQYEIVNIASTDDIQGVAIGLQIDDLTGCYDQSNTLSIRVDCVSGGSLSTQDNTTFCGISGDMVIELDLVGNKGDQTAYLITDANGTILSISDDAQVFVGIPELADGISLWSISYADGTSINVGDQLQHLSNCYDLSNSIELSLYDIAEATITTDSPTVFCEDNFGVVSVDIQSSSASSVFVVVDNANEIHLISDSPEVDLSSLNPDNYTIYQISYDGILSGLSLGANLNNVEGCLALSNGISVKASELDAGKLLLENGEVAVSVCVGDCDSDLIHINLTGNHAAEGVWFITDADGIITSLAVEPPFDFENSTIGTCMVWYMAYESGLTGLAVGNHIFDFEGCYDLTNSITITKYGLGLDGNSYAHVDFDDCHSHPDSLTNVDYSEFVAEIYNEEDCANIDLVGGFVYRNNPEVNKHSCTPGVDDSPAMCVSSSNDCTYEADSDYAIRFSVELTPGLSGTALLSSLSFYESAPETFDWINGADGINNYPTKYGIRISIDGTEIYREDEIPTTHDYTLESFDFNGIAAFEVNQTSIFDVELLAYCNTENGGPVSVWDIDNLHISSACNSKLYAGDWDMDQGDEIELCLADEISDIITFNTTHGPFDYQYIVTNAQGGIIFMAEDNTVDFSLLGAGIYQVYGVAYIGNIYPALGSNIDFLIAEGCYAITETAVNVVVVDACPDSLEPVEPILDFTLSPNPSVDFIKLGLISIPGATLDISIYNDLGQKVKNNTYSITDETEFMLDLRGLSAGMYIVKVRSGDQELTKKIIKITR